MLETKVIIPRVRTEIIFFYLFNTQCRAGAISAKEKKNFIYTHKHYIL